jgi:hypothetical protein
MSEASPHQFRTRNAPTKAQRTRSNSNEKTAKSTNLIDILPLITVWLQVRALPQARGRECGSVCVTLRSAISTASLLTYGRHEHERALESAEPPVDLSYFLGVFTGLEETAGL